MTRIIHGSSRVGRTLWAGGVPVDRAFVLLYFTLCLYCCYISECTITITHLWTLVLYACLIGSVV